MKFAIVENDIVTNVAEGLMPLDANWHEIPIDVPVAIGDTFDGQAFYDENKEMRMSHVQNLSKKLIDSLGVDVDDLEKDGTLKTAQIQALSDMLDFYEECIAEIACVVYA